MNETFPTLIHALLRHGERAPERPYATFVEAGESWTYGTAYARAESAAGALHGRGLRRGERVVIVGGNEPAVAALVLGAIGSGMVPAVVHPPLRADVGAARALLDRVIARADPALVVAPRSLWPSDGAAVTASSLLDDAAPRSLEPPREDAVCYLQFSSGTTGPQKAVAISAGAQARNCEAIATEIHGTPDETWLSWLPFYHDMGLVAGLLIPLYSGQACVVLRPERFVERPMMWLQAIHDHRAAMTIAPNFAYALVARRATAERLRGLDLSCLRVAFNGAEMVHAETVRRFEESLAPAGLRPNTVLPVYGLAELTLAAAFWRVGEPMRVDHVARAGLSRGVAEPEPADVPGTVPLVSVGHAIVGHDARVMCGERVAADREVGEIEVNGPSKMSGYWGELDRTAEVTHGDWLRTGDLGYVADGDLFVCGRSKNVVVRFGENFFPSDLEQATSSAPGVKPGRLAVLGIEDPEMATERVWLVIETDATGRDAYALAKSVRDYVVSAAGFKFDGVTCVPPKTIEKTSSGKIKRHALREKLHGATLGRWPDWPGDRHRSR